MEIKILQVFYDENGLPYKDKERTVHYPITSGTFLGASNTTQIRFYYDQLDELNESTFVAVSKLPNGKIGSEILESEYDSELQENYAVLNLSQFYTQYKGDVYISLQGYQGGVRVEQDENGIYQIYGTPTIQATGSIKLSIAYAPTFIGSGQTENITLQRVLAELSTKLGIRQETLHVEELPTVGNQNVWYVVNDDPNDTTKANIYIWNATTQTYVWVGDNTLDLGDYYTQEQGEQFEQDVRETIGNGSPKGVYATLSDLESAFPTGTNGIYVVEADGKWYYWSGSAWTAGGTYLAADLTSYVPYTGATQDLDLGSHKINAKAGTISDDGFIVGVADTNYIQLRNGYYFNRKYNNKVTSYFIPPTTLAQDNIATQAWIKSIGLSGIDGRYSTLEDLESAIPTGNLGTFLITQENSWYYWNGTTWTNGGYYIENTNYTLTTKLAVLNAQTFNAITMCDNAGFLNASGQFVSNSSYRTSDFIRVYANHSYKYNLRHATTLPVICFYADIKESSFISNVIGASGFTSGTFTPNQDGYVRITRFNSDIESNYFYDSTSQPDFAVGISNNTENQINNHILGYNSQICFSLYNNVENAFLRVTGEKVSNSGYRTTAPIFVKQGQTIRYRLKHGTELPIIVLYSEPVMTIGNFIEKVDGSNSVIEGTYIPSQDGYVAFVRSANYEDGYVAFQENLPDLFKKVDNNNVVAKLNVLCMGDSIFGNDGEIPAYLNNYTKSCVNGAFGGTRVSVRSSGSFQYFDGVNIITALTSGNWTNQDNAASTLSSDYPWITSRLANLKAVDMSNIDVLIMDWGTNDYTASATIEEINTAYNSIFDMLQTTYPNLRILVTTPIWRYWGTEQDNENGDNKVYNVSTLKQIAFAIESNCKDRRINVLNAYQELPLSYKNSATYFDIGDGTHLNSNGNLMYAHLLRGKLESIF